MIHHFYIVVSLLFSCSSFAMEKDRGGAFSQLAMRANSAINAGSNHQFASPVYINSLPRTIAQSGLYFLSPTVYERPGFKHDHFSSAIRVYNNTNVVLDLNGNTLNANGRVFGIDANGAYSVCIVNGTIINAVRPISSLNNTLVVVDVHSTQCVYSSIESTPRTTYLKNVSYGHNLDKK